MNTKSKFPEAASVVEDHLKIKTLDLCLATSGGRLEQKVKTVFDLAKSAGQELNVTFGSEASKLVSAKGVRLGASR